jgi:hypothetical protein
MMQDIFLYVRLLAKTILHIVRWESIDAGAIARRLPPSIDRRVPPVAG